MLPKSSVALLAALAFPLLLAGCAPPRDAIAVSDPAGLDFAFNPFPRTILVWNKDPETPNLRIAVTPLQDWIITDVRNVQSAGPVAANGPFDRRSVQVSIDRRRLLRGTHTGEIEFSAPGAKPFLLRVTVQQDQDGQRDSLQFGENGVLVDYASPYLLDFRFSLKDADDRSIVAEPGQITVEAAENAGAVPLESGAQLKRAAARQLKVELLLDYTFSIQQAPGAIAAMENAAIDVLLPALNEDALVGVTEFHRDDQEASRVVPFTVDRPFLAASIRGIQQNVVGGFFSGARMYDAIRGAAARFTGDPLNESRILLLFSDGRDTSSTRPANEAIAAALNRDIRIYAIGFGQAVDTEALTNLAVSTGGAYFPATNANQLALAFERIIEDLDGQYSLRWATLKRDNREVIPSFTLRLGADSLFFAGPRFVPENLGPPASALRGQLRIVPSSSETRTTVFLRADYVPRAVQRLRILLASPVAFTVRQVGFADDGLLAGWSVSTQSDAETGGTWIDARTNAVPLSFATFGPLLRIDFAELVPDNVPLFTEVFVDNSIYTAGQSFSVLGFE